MEEKSERKREREKEGKIFLEKDDDGRHERGFK